MKNSKFVEEIVAGRVAAPTARNRSGYREASNVLYDGTHIYSYGSHYPLMLKLETANGTRWILNDRGYSSSTGRHISGARPYADAAVKFTGSVYDAPAGIIEAARAEIIDQHAHIDVSREKIAKRPKHAAVYEQSIARAQDRISNLERACAIADAAREFKSLNA